MSNGNQLSYGELIPKLEISDTDEKAVALTIAKIREQDMAPRGSGRADVKLVIEFAERFKGDTPDKQRREYVVNATSYKTLCDQLGSSDYQRWVGRQIVMAPTTNTFNGRAFTKMHVAAPDRWAKVLAATEKARGATTGKKASR